MTPAFKWVARLEGGSFLLLMLVAMPLKYGWDAPALVKHTGRLHGLLVMLFIGTLAHAARTAKWPARTVAWAMFSSMIPAGFFFFEASVKPREPR